MGNVYFEEWDSGYGSPYHVSEDAGEGHAEIVETGRGMAISPTPCALVRTAFVDGVRRAEGILHRVEDDGSLSSGAVGAYACGSVLCEPSQRPRYGPVRVNRLAIFGSNRPALLPDQGGFRWHVIGIESTDPDAPLQELQNLMRQAEASLAERIAAEGWLTVVDGPLNYVRSRELPVCGLVKTHLRPLLEPTAHGRIAALACPERTPLFALGEDRFSCYVRIRPRGPLSSPWYGIVRLEVPQISGLEAAVRTVDQVACALPTFAGVPHRDPRAPQNLQPVGALEKTLRRRLGNRRLASRAARLAVAAGLREPDTAATTTPVVDATLNGREAA
jgi:hypothetical protein